MQKEKNSIEWKSSDIPEFGMLCFSLLETLQQTNETFFLPVEVGINQRVPEKDEVFPPDIAKSYVEACGVDSNADDPIEMAEIQFLLEQIGRHNGIEGLQVLECGTGPGTLAKLMMEQGAFVTATDASQTMIDLASDHHADAVATNRLRFELGEARNLPFSDSSFGFVTAKHLLHQLPTEAAFRFLQEVVRVTKSDGIIIIGDYNRLSSRADRDARLEFTLPEMRPLLEETFDASFTPKELEFMLQQIPGIEFAVVIAEDPARLSEDLRKRIEADPVKGHSTDWRTRLRVVIHKLD